VPAPHGALPSVPSVPSTCGLPVNPPTQIFHTGQKRHNRSTVAEASMQGEKNEKMRERALNTNETEQSVGRQTQWAQTRHGRSCRSRCCCCRRRRKSRQQRVRPARPRELDSVCARSAREGHERLRSRHPGWQLGGAAPATGHGTRGSAGGPSSGPRAAYTRD
jgi:hypothetical protein